MTEEVYITGRGLVTPIGNTPEEVFQAVREGRSALKQYADTAEPYWASRLDRSGFTGESFFENIAIEAAQKAIQEADIDTAEAGFILSTIKGDIEHLGSRDISLAASASNISKALGVQTAPVVVSNACISGLAAMVQSMRMMSYKVPAFIQAVRQFFREVDLETLVDEELAPLSDWDSIQQQISHYLMSGTVREPWQLIAGAVRNDANHISGPSRTGEGSYNALKAVLPYVAKEDLAFVNVHGTATRYNDEMEAIALERAGLLDVPVNSLKGVFGHTMGAAGILECLVSMQALEAGIVLPTRGFNELGVSMPVKVSTDEQKVKGSAFIKLLSGFGGVNGAMLLRKGGE